MRNKLISLLICAFLYMLFGCNSKQVDDVDAEVAEHLVYLLLPGEVVRTGSVSDDFFKDMIVGVKRNNLNYILRGDYDAEFGRLVEESFQQLSNAINIPAQRIKADGHHLDAIYIYALDDFDDVENIYEKIKIESKHFFPVEFNKPLTGSIVEDSVLFEVGCLVVSNYQHVNNKYISTQSFVFISNKLTGNLRLNRRHCAKVSLLTALGLSMMPNRSKTPSVVKSPWGDTSIAEYTEYDLRAVKLFYDSNQVYWSGNDIASYVEKLAQEGFYNRPIISISIN